MSHLRRRRAVLLVGLLLPLVVTAAAHARAGGGHGFSGGGGGFHGGGGGGFHSSGGGSFHIGGGGYSYSHSSGVSGDDAVFWLVVILIIVIVVAANAYKAYNESDQTDVIRRGSSLDVRNRDAEASLAIRQSDPAFDKDAFLARVRVAFDKTQAAWSKQNLSTVRPFLSDGVHERFGLQFMEQKALGFRNQVEQVEVLGMALAQADCAQGPFDVLSVRIAARARDFDLSLVTGQKIAGTDRDEPFAEVWSFLRRRGAATDPTKPGLIEGHCPNCGAELLMNQAANCAHCGAQLRSGQFDWVLAEITQESVWRNGRPTSMPGVEMVRQRDPGLTVQELEDFGSVCFWRKATADRTRDPRALAKVSTAGFLEDYSGRLMPRAGEDGAYGYVGQCAVGSVRTLGILADEDRERALLEVRWSGTRFVARPREVPEKTGPDVLTRTLLVLERGATAVSNVDLALSSNHCPSCGAPISHDTASTCESCGNVLTDPRNGWLLAAFHSMASPEATALTDRLAVVHARQGMVAAPAATDQSAGDLLAWLVSVAMADGVITAGERQQLDAVAQKHALPQQYLARLVNAAANGQLHPPTPRDQDEARLWLSTMVDLSLADGRVDPAEVSLLRAAGARVNWSDYDLGLLIKRRRHDLYAEARGRA